MKISDEVLKLSKEVEQQLEDVFKVADEVEAFNTAKVLDAFNKNQISEAHFASTTGYGYGDLGRDAIEKVYKDIFKAEDALVRTQFVSGSHTICKTLFALLRPNDLLLSITGTPYDTLREVIGIIKNPSSLKSFGILYDEIDLVDNDFDYEKIADYLTKKEVKVIEIQRSRGYSLRKSILLENVEKVIKLIKKISPKTIVMVDNCYCELVCKKEPIEVGADIVVGSLIKNLGGGIANNGGYVVGKKDLIQLVSESLTLPGEGKNVGPSLGANKSFLQGLFLAPSVVNSALKTAILTSALLEKLGYKVDPSYNEKRADIVQTIYFQSQLELEEYAKAIQNASAIDSFVTPVSSFLPGYKEKIIMASGSFVQGSSIELSCDGPIKEPYVLYQQGALTYQSGKLGVLHAIDRLRSIDGKK